MKESSERSEKLTELLKGMTVTVMDVLSFDKALKIAIELVGTSSIDSIHGSQDSCIILMHDSQETSIINFSF